MVSKALSCITSQLDSIKDSYATALVTYTLMLANHGKAAEMMKKLRKKAISEGIKDLAMLLHAQQNYSVLLSIKNVVMTMIRRGP